MRPFLHAKVIKTEPIISPKELIQHLPTHLSLQNSILRKRQELVDILSGKDQRAFVVVGPCSIHDPISAIEYGMRLKELQEKVQDQLLLVMRLYFEKPRTCLGWKGYITDPHLSHSPEPKVGFTKARQLLIEIAQMGVATATEFLTPYTPLYYGDLVTWGCIGARTSASPLHRQMASALPMPCGFKNSVEGCLDAAINGIQAASAPQSYLGIDEEATPVMIHSRGNPHCNLVLRGADSGPNYNDETIQLALTKLKNHSLNPRIIIDCSHGNSNKNPIKQINTFQDLMPLLCAENGPIAGLMLESHLNFGKQTWSAIEPELHYGVSITDSCLDWERTEELLLELNNALQPQMSCASSSL